MKEKKRRFENDVTEYEYLFQEKEVRGKKKSRFLGRVLRKNFWSLFWSSVVYIIKASPVWATPIVTTNIINTLTFYLKGSMELSDAIRSVVVNAVVLTVLIVQNIPMHMLWAKICSRMFRENSANTRSAVVKKLQRLSITYHKEMETGKIQSKFLRDVESMDALISNIQNNLLPSIFGVLISIGISLYNSRIMTVFFLVVIPVNVALAMLFNKKMRKNFRTLRKDSEEVAGKLSTIMEMLVVTKAHGLEEKEYNDFQKQIDRLKKSGRSADMTNAYFGSVAWVLSNLLSGVCLAFCAYLAFRGEIDVGDIVLYQSLFSSINNNVLLLINIMPQLVQGVDSVHSISEIMNTNDIEETHIGVNPPEITGRVDFNCVSYRYPDSDQHVVKNFDLHGRPRRMYRGRRLFRFGEEHADEYDHRVFEARFRNHCGGREVPLRSGFKRIPPLYLRRSSEQYSLCGHRAGKHYVRSGPLYRGGPAARRQDGERGGVRQRFSRGTGYADRRTRRQAFGRAETAHHDCARAHPQPQDPHSGRGDQRA